MAITLRAKQRLAAAMIISFAFFVTELAVAFKTSSLALMADSFHYMNDLLSFGVALGAIFISERKESPQWLTYGWQRAQTLGAFFNGVFLLALGMSIFFQSIERFIAIRKVENVMLILVMGVVGLTLNIISAAFLHEHHDHSYSNHHHHHHQIGRDVTLSGIHGQHETKDIPVEYKLPTQFEYEIDKISLNLDSSSVEDTNSTDMKPALHVDTRSIGDAESQTSSTNNSKPSCPLTSNRHEGHRHPLLSQARQSPSRDIGMMGVMIHVIGDAINNLGIIVASLFIWFMTSESRYYADPAVSVGISLMIFMTALPLVRTSGAILLQGAPEGINIADVRHDLEIIPGIESVHEVHIWRLDQRKTIASVHVVLSNSGSSSTSPSSLAEFMDQASTIRECLHAYGVHSVTLQPELRRRIDLGSPSPSPLPSASASVSVSVSVDTASVESVGEDINMSKMRQRNTRRNIDANTSRCEMVCGSGSGKGYCEELMCCREDMN